MNAATILLEPLSEDEAETLIENLLAGSDLSDQVRRRITASAEGNPLFVEQMLALLAQEATATARWSFRRRFRRCSRHGSSSFLRGSASPPSAPR